MFGRQRMTDTLPSFVFDPHIDSKTRSKLIEKEMNEQVCYFIKLKIFLWTFLCAF
jgi:hypothetical protein